MIDRSGWPRVTKVIAAAGLIDTAHMAEYDRDRGTVLHECVALLVEGTLDRESVDPAVAGRLAQFERWLVEARPRILACEREVWHEGLKYAGRLDLVIDEGHAPFVTIVDIKGPTRQPWHGVQLAAYLHAYADCMVALPARRFTLHLSDDDYRLVQHTDKQDWPRFVAALKNYGSENDRTSHA